MINGEGLTVGIRFSSLQNRLRHIKRKGKTILKYRKYTIIGILCALVVVVAVSSYVYLDRLSGDQNSLEIYLGSLLKGRLEQQDSLAQPEGIDLLDALRRFGAAPLQNESIILLDENGQTSLLELDPNQPQHTLYFSEDGWYLQEDGRQITVQRIVVGED